MAGGAVLTNKQLIKAAENLVLVTGKYRLVYWECINLPAHQKTFNSLFVHLNTVYQVQNEMRGTTNERH